MILQSTQGGSRLNFKVGFFLPCVSNMYSLKDIKLVQNLATRDCSLPRGVCFLPHFSMFLRD